MPATVVAVGDKRVAESTRGHVIRRTSVEDRLSARGVPVSWEGEPPAEFAGLAVDSRSVVPGDLFCAIRGTQLDGHDFLDRAAAAGATAALVERPVPDVSLPLGVVSDTRIAAAHVASLQRGDPAVGLRLLVGVTGTNGKTTTVLVLRHLLGLFGPAAGLGTLGLFEPSGTRRPGHLTTPGPVELMEDLVLARRLGAESVAMEVSSHALAQRRVEALTFDGAVFTNLTREHLDYHPDMRGYREAKLQLADRVTPSGVCVVNAEDPAWEGQSFAGRRVVTFGVSRTAHVRAEDVFLHETGSRWSLAAGGSRFDVDLPLVGDFNVLNALGAVTAALELGLTADALAARLATVPQVPGRMEVLARHPRLVLRDYAHTPDAYSRVLATLRRMVRGRLLIVFGCGGDRDRGKRPLMGRIAAELCDALIITTDNPRTEDPARIASDIVTGLPERSYRLVPDREEAIEIALSETGPGDAVLLAGKGHETYQDIEGVRVPFDEAGIVARWIDAEGGQ